MLYEYVLIIFLIFNTLKHKGRILKGYSILLWLWIVIVYLSWLFFYDSIYARASIIYSILFFFFISFSYQIKNFNMSHLLLVFKSIALGGFSLLGL